RRVLLHGALDMVPREHVLELRPEASKGTVWRKKSRTADSYKWGFTRYVSLCPAPGTMSSSFVGLDAASYIRRAVSAGTMESRPPPMNSTGRDFRAAIAERTDASCKFSRCPVRRAYIGSTTAASRAREAATRTPILIHADACVASATR